MKNNLSREQFFSVSIMLFGLFFGAGNLIFPPLLGKQAGSASFQSLLAFGVTAVVFPILGLFVLQRLKVFQIWQVKWINILQLYLLL